MAGRIPQSFIDDLVSRADIVEIINARVPLKKKGREYSACCPFHNEKTPSFTVSETKQFYHCFGCGAHGTVIGFLMEYENLDFVDAIEALAAEYNLDVPRESGAGISQQARDEKQGLYEIIEKASRLYQQQLKTSERAVNYLKQRGLTGEIARTYQLGYAPDSWDFLTSGLGTNNNALADLVKTGLVVKKDNGKTYDRFRDRIIFPITDRRGRIIGFGGRIIDQGEPKYLNSPENAVFHKGQELYGLYEARKAVRNLERIIIVEGYMDVVALAQHGIPYAIASLGTATTKEQIQITLRTVPEIIFCYDGDAAGLKAAWHALENTLPAVRDGHTIKFLFLPEKEDPDSMVRKHGKQQFEELIAQASPLSEFFFDHLLKTIDIKTEEGKATLQKKAIPLLSSMTESIFRDLLYKKLSELVGLPVEKLGKNLATDMERRTPPRRSENIGQRVKLNATRTAVALLLQHPELVEVALPDEFKNAPDQGVNLLSKLYKMIQDNPGITTTSLLERWRDTDDFPILQKLMQQDIRGIQDRQGLMSVYRDTIARLLARYHDYRFQLLETKLLKSGLNDDEKAEYNALSRLR